MEKMALRLRKTKSKVCRLTRGVVFSPEEASPRLSKLVRFHIGNRVRVRILVDLIKEKDINCDKGTIVDSTVYRPLTPKYTRIRYVIALDDVYAKKGHWFHKYGSRISYEEGLGVDASKQSIKLI